MYPIKLKPVFKDYLWGGEKLKTDFHMDTDISPVAEAWVLSCHPDGESRIENGEYAGKTLWELVQTLGREILGKNSENEDRFPILIKLIDARDNLSVQVHPDDEYALRVEGEPGKTEMWYVMDCEDGAYLYYGFNRDITKEEFGKRIENNTLLEVLNKVTVKKGDCFLIKAGTLHAIGKGILIAEIQQNSNTTYRVYDYGRVDAAGTPRQLHTQKALQFTNTAAMRTEIKDPSDPLLCKSEYFTCELLTVEAEKTLVADEHSFVSVLVLEGTGTVSAENSSVSFVPGDCFFIPAASGEVRLQGKARVIITRV